MNHDEPHRLRAAELIAGICDKHGQFERMSYVERPPCPDCEHERQEREREERAEQRREELRQEALSRANLRGRFRDATFGSFNATTSPQRKVLLACQAFAAGPMDQWRVLFLIGPPGSGKTHLGAAMAHATIARGRGARVLTVREMVRRIRDTWHRDAEQSEQDVLDDLAGCGLLVLDEIGVGSGTDAELLQLLDVVDLRYQLSRPLVAISNLNAEQIRATVGDRLFDRLREGAEVHACAWASHRRPAA